jgi:FxsC-like protein
MGYEFFLSYTRANNDAYLSLFFNDLSEAIRDRRGKPQAEKVGFFDQRALELGEEWDDSIVEALQSSPVLVAVYSPAYFKSEYCGKELALFHARCEAARQAGGRLPPLVKPVIWVPFKPTELPPGVAGIQYATGDPQGLHNQRGVKYLLKQLQEYKTQYNDFLYKLADELVAAADAYPLPRLPQPPPLKGAPSLFAMGTGNRGNDPPPRSPPSGPKHVRFVYVAASPQAFGSARSAAAYLEAGGSDWKPFFPDNTTRVHRLLQNVACNDDLDFTSEELPFGPNLIAEIDEAWKRRQIVVLVVDGWSVHWDAQYRAVLKALDHRVDPHWCVLVPWNEQDGDSVRRGAEIRDSLNVTFDMHKNLLRNPMFFRDSIHSAEELKTAVRQVLMQLKEEIRKRAPIDMPVPAGPARSILSGPSGKV